MKLTDLHRSLYRFRVQKPDFEFELNEGANDQLFENTQSRLGLTIPDNTREFFKTFNGLRTKNPELTILDIEEWTRAEQNLVHFSTFNNKIKIYFDTTELNQADQWTIKNPSAYYDLTFTMRSFWSNKIWHWIKYQREIWRSEF